MAFYVVRGRDSGSPAFNAFPSFDYVTTNNLWHWHDPANPEKYRIDIPTTPPTTLMQIEENPFAWELRVPQASLFRTITHAENDYIQWTTIGGANYRDAVVNSATYAVTTSARAVPALTFQDLASTDKKIGGGERVGVMTIYVLAEDMAGNVEYRALKYWLWPEGDRPQVISINNPDSTRIKAERLLNGSIRLSGMARDNENVKYVWFRVRRTVNGVAGEPYTNLEIPVWNEQTWEEAVPAALQSPREGSTIGSMKAQPYDELVYPTGGWYMANGGGSRNVTWWAYINTNGELDPQGDLDANEITIEVRAQDVTWDDAADNWMAYSPDYNGFVSPAKVVDAWVVAGAPVFDKVQVAKGVSVPAREWASIDRMSIKDHSAYRVTVMHNAGLSAIRWSPTQWTTELNGGAGGFRADPDVEPYNLLNMPEGHAVYRSGDYYATAPLDDAVYNMLNAAAAVTDINMAVSVEPRGQKKGPGTVTLNASKNYMVWKWDAVLEQNVLKHDDSHNEPPTPAGVHKDMKNTVFKPLSSGSFNIGDAVLLESDPDNEGDVGYFKWDVIVDARADLLLKYLFEVEDPNYGNLDDNPDRAGQVVNSVRYPVYLSAVDGSRSTPLTTRGDTLLPIDNLAPFGVYTLNRKPAGTAATLGGEAGDNGPVSGIAKVVVWFSRDNKKNGTREFISWHENDISEPAVLAGVSGFTDAPGSGEGWWDDNGVIAAWNARYTGNAIKQVRKPKIPAEGATTGGDYAIVIDRNNPSGGTAHHGHKLAMGFSDGGEGKHWYVEINSFGIKSGPVTLHYVVIDKAGNAAYYYEPLFVMNNAPKIDKVKLATDIRHNAVFLTDFPANRSEGTGTAGGSSPILEQIRTRAHFGDTDVQKGISEDIYSSAMGANKMIDFNVRNNLFALRVETTAGSGADKARKFRLEYVSDAAIRSDTEAAGKQLTDIKAGRVYIIDDPGTARWGAVGAEGDGPWPRGYAFLAAVDGRNDEGLDRITGEGSAWELNSHYYNNLGVRTVTGSLPLADVTYNAATSGDPNATGAEFVYNFNAFSLNAGDRGNKILDYGGTDEYPSGPGGNPARDYSMFIVRVFDGDDEDMFGDFTILRVRVNNDDKTLAFSQLYDINPKTEGQERASMLSEPALERMRLLTPMSIGEGSGSNRTKGGLWNTATTVTAVSKPGHIEPRKTTSLTSGQMGGAASAASATYVKPYVSDSNRQQAMFEVDTLSGQVVLRGYAEDNQRIAQVYLIIGGTVVPILQFQANNNTAGSDGYGRQVDNAAYLPARTGLLQVASAQAGKVYFTDEIDLYRHRVEWAYIWDTETTPANTVVATNLNVRVYANNRMGLATAAPINKFDSPGIAAPGEQHTNASPNNPGFPVGLNKYNQINVNLRPYITGFLRRKDDGGHDTRSRQGWYPVRQAEDLLVTGFNMGGSGMTSRHRMPGAAEAGSPANAATIGEAANFGFPSNEAYRCRYINGVNTGSIATEYGVFRFWVTRSGVDYYAANTGPERRGAPTQVTQPWAVLPWNKEYSMGVEGSDLWDDYTRVHVWRSNNNAGADGGRFAATGAAISRPSMSIAPSTGILWESHTEATPITYGFTPWGSNRWLDADGIVYTVRTTPITNTAAQASINGTTAVPADSQIVMTSLRNIGEVDVYRSPGSGSATAENWVVANLLGGNTNSLLETGGIYIRGPGGRVIPLSGGYFAFNTGWVGNLFHPGLSDPNDPNYRIYDRTLYYGESAFYNGGIGDNPMTQFMNPHIVTSYIGGYEILHVSYYDIKDGSIKYRFNFRGGPEPGNTNTEGYNNDPWGNNILNLPRLWVNLDGGLDQEDVAATSYYAGQTGNNPAGTFAENSRVVRWSGSINGTKTARRNINAGRHNAIAVALNANGSPVPVIAYYDETNSRLKLAVSIAQYPFTNESWVIRDYVIPRTSASSFGTGEYVSMKVDTRAGANQNRVHIAAMNGNKRLVYITGILKPQWGLGNTEQTDQTAAASNVLTDVKVQVVDSVGIVGKWCALSLDADGNPWITYMDEKYLDYRDGIKAAVFNQSRYYKGLNPNGTGSEYTDMYGTSLEGWETMHIPTLYNVNNPVEAGREHGRLALECFPTRNFTGTVTTSRVWSAAVGYLSQEGGDRYRVAYYVK